MSGERLHAPLDIDRLRQRRAGARLGAQIEYFDSIDSTNTVIARLGDTGAAEGAVAIAEAQSKGRGRLGRTWSSPPFRNLYLSVLLRPPVAASVAPQLTLVAGLAAVETVSAWVERAVLKWPNDVLIDGRKAAGILTEMAADGEQVRYVVVGIGINVNAAAADFPVELQDKATSVYLATGMAADRVAVADRLLSCLEERYRLFLRAGFAAVRPLWEARSGLSGKEVTVDDGARRLRGVVMGLADDGSLRLRDARGAEILVVAGDVTMVDGYPTASRPRPAAS